jgi:hypothetical protein
VEAGRQLPGVTMSRIAAFILGWAREVLLWLDQGLNVVLIPIFTWTIGWADETLSARCGRNYLKGRLMARFFIVPIDWAFSWQKPDPTITDAQGVPIKSHCVRAFRKEQLRRGLHPDYR